MGTRIIMPSGGQTTDESLVTWWYKKVGEEVHLGEPLFSIETDKATMDVESCAEGTLLAIYHQADDVVKAGELMGIVGQPGEAVPMSAESAGELMQSASAPVQAGETAEPAIPSAQGQTSEKPIGHAPDGKVIASPAARKLAHENGLELSALMDDFSSKPVKRAQVQQWLDRAESQEQADPPLGQGETHLVKPSSIRRSIARRMCESVALAPQYAVRIEVDMGSALALREKWNHHLAKESVKIAIHDILMKCVCAALSKYPVVNASYREDAITFHHDVHFGLAVSLDDGLVVPVVRHADKKSILSIARNNAINIQKARQGKLVQEEMTGGTITLSNLGMYGITGFTAILNPPESCIIAMGSVMEKPVVRNGGLVIGKVMEVTATFDHRLIDGAVGASFLKEVKFLLENPEFLLLHDIYIS